MNKIWQVRAVALLILETTFRKKFRALYVKDYDQHI